MYTRKTRDVSADAPPKLGERWTEPEIRRLSVLSQTDPRTCRRFLRGDTVRSLSAMRIRKALKGFVLRREENSSD